PQGKDMKKQALLALSLILLTGCGRNIRTAEDVTPGNIKETCMSWKYGATDIRIQTGKITKELVDRWIAKTKYDITHGKPRIIITHIDNRTDMVISTDMIRDIIEHAAVDDGRVTMLVGDAKNEQELDMWLKKITKDPKYAKKSRVERNEVQAPQFLAKIRIVKAMTEQKRYDIEEYLMTLTLYDLETQEIVDSATDLLRKKVRI
ncbi:MAG TPA: hypothetical protein VFU89_05640, partial [Rhabdochlamydiaceae bacterium]|nr:hypothetical protein [Rhabdochlamydiaceae bacterium]